MKSYIINFTAKNKSKDVHAIKAAGVGNDEGEAVESAKKALMAEHPDIGSYNWVAMTHHMKLTPGKLE